MNDNVYLNRTNIGNLDTVPSKSGSITFTKDEKGLYIDFSNDKSDRIKITDIEIIPANSNIIKDKTSLNTYISNIFNNKLYVFTESKDILTYYSGNWIKLNNDSGSGIVYETTSSFTFTNDTITIATSNIPDGASIGSLLVDGNDNLGLINSLNGDNANINLLIDNRKSNTLTNDIYLDCNYIGEEVGTIEKPFNNIHKLLSYCENNLKNEGINTVIHIINIESTDNFNWSGIKNCKFMAYENKINMSLIDSDNIKIIAADINNLVFYGDNLTCIDSKCDNCEIHSDNLFIERCNLSRGTIQANNKLTLTSNRNINLIDITGDYVSIFNIDKNTTYVTNVTIKNSKLNILDLTNVANKLYANFYIENSIIDKFNTNTIRVNGNIYLLSGALNNTTNLDICSNIFDTDGNNIGVIDLGIFDFKGCNLQLEGTLLTDRGLSSKQVYDKNVRSSYKNTSTSLESHLNAINKILNELQSDIATLQIDISKLKG